MADLPVKARVVIIGGGVVGASCLYHLAKAGWSDCILLEKNELTAGSTWHAAGNIPNFSSDWGVMAMQQYSTSLYRRLGEEVDYPMNYHVSGAIRLAHSKERMQEFERVAGMGHKLGLPIEIMSPEEGQEKFPFMETHDLSGILYDPYDGDIDPAQLTQAFAKGAREMGAKIVRFCPVTGATRDGNEWVIETEKGEVRCDYVVNAAGYYSQRVGQMFGRHVPMMVMSHQYILFEDHKRIEEWTKNNGGKLPMIRDVDSSYYLRQEQYGMNLGPYERNCKGHWLTADDAMPDDFSFQLYDDDLDRLEWYLEDAMARVPVLGEMGLSKVINGPIPYSPDGLPLIGPMPGVPNAFEACVFTFGICQAGGAGKVITDWITKGSPEWDMWSVDPRRFTDYCDQDYCNVKGMEVYGHEYAMHFPHYEWPEGRGKKLSPINDLLASKGAQFGAINGWERANWFAKEGDDTSLEAAETWERDGPWQVRVREECEAVRDAAGMIDMPGFSRYRVKGAGAREWLNGLTTSIVPKTGRLGLAYFCDDNGRVVTEMSIMALDEDFFFLLTAAVAEWHDFEWLQKHLPAGTEIELLNVTKEFGLQILSGPKSRDILSDLCDADLTLPWLTHQTAQINGKYCQLVRVSYVGELGWEVHAKFEDMPVIVDAIYAAGEKYGLKPFGMYALNSLRLEKGYRSWKGDLSTDYTALESGLERFIRFKKPEFKGRDALLAEQERGVAKRFVTMVVEDNPFDAPYMANLWHDGVIVGEVTSCGYGYRVGALIALGVVKTDLAEVGTELEVEIYGKRYKAQVQEDQPLWDPENLRIRA